MKTYKIIKESDALPMGWIEGDTITGNSISANKSLNAYCVDKKWTKGTINELHLNALITLKVVEEIAEKKPWDLTSLSRYLEEQICFITDNDVFIDALKNVTFNTKASAYRDVYFKVREYEALALAWRDKNIKHEKNTITE